MKVGELVQMRGGLPAMGIVLREERVRVGFVDTDNPRVNRVEVYWIEDAESSWEPIKWLKVISAS